MNDHISYDANALFLTLENSCKDPLFSQEYADLLREQLNKGLDLLLDRGQRGSSMLFRYMGLLYTKEQYHARIFHLGQAAQMLVWMKQNYTSELLSNHEKLFQQTCQEINFLHDSRENWKNPALCSVAIRQIEQCYQEIHLNDLSARLGINTSYLSRVLSQSLCVTFLDLLHTKRLLVAMDHFAQPEKPPRLEELAAALGYSSNHYFYCVAKRYVGLTPSEICHMMRS